MRTLLAAGAGRWLGIGLALSMLFVPGAAAAAEPTEPTFTFTGGGFGHGTGMSQYGAQGQALEGRSWQTILNTYFTGVDFAVLRTDGEYASGASGSDGADLVGDVHARHDTPMVHSRVHGSVAANLLLLHLRVRRRPGSAFAQRRTQAR